VSRWWEVNALASLAVVQRAGDAIIAVGQVAEALTLEAVLVLSTRVLVIAPGSVGRGHIGAPDLWVAEVEGAGVIVVAGEGLPDADAAVAVVLMGTGVEVVTRGRRVPVDAALIRDTRVRGAWVPIVTIALFAAADALIVARISLRAGVPIPARLSDRFIDVLTSLAPVTGVCRTGVPVTAREPLPGAQP
jgi:hypothetical protein